MSDLAIEDVMHSDLKNVAEHMIPSGERVEPSHDAIRSDDKR